MGRNVQVEGTVQIPVCIRARLTHDIEKILADITDVYKGNCEQFSSLY